MSVVQKKTTDRGLLREAAVQYEVLAKNDPLYVDELTVDAVVRWGVIRPRFPGEEARARPYREPDDAVWSMSVESDVARLRSAMWMRAGLGLFVAGQAQGLIERAEDLRADLVAALESG